jgi:hypothetical protein
MSLTWTSLPDLDPSGISSPVAGEVVGSPAIDGCGTNSFAYTDAPMRNNAPVAGAYSSSRVPPLTTWEVRMRVSRTSGGSRVADGNIFVGLTRALTSDINQWDYCLNVSTSPRVVRGFPHPGKSVLVYEGGIDSSFPPRPVFWRHGIWESNDQLIRFQCINEILRYFVDDTLVYISTKPPSYTPDLVIGVLFDCSGQKLSDVEILSDNSVLIGSQIAQGPLTGADCEGLFPVPQSVSVPVGVTRIAAAVSQMPPLPQGPVDPIPVQFRETTMQWGEFQQQFGTGVKAANTLQQRPIRRFEIEWQGLSPEQAGILDSHYERTHSGIPFSIRHVHTGEIVDGCRYASYSRGDQVRYWVQSRSAVIVRYA